MDIDRLTEKCSIMKGITLLILLFAHIVLGQTPISLIHTPVRDRHIKADLRYTMIETPLEIVNGMTFVKARLNGRTGNYLFDTGAPLLILNKSEVGADKLQAASVGGAFTVASVQAKDFSWAGNNYPVLEAVAIDLAHLEESSAMPLAGIIGFEVIKNHELFIDYRSGQLAVLESSNNKLSKTATPRFVIPFELQDHLPVIRVVIDGKELRFGIDTGAAVNLIDQKYEPALSGGSYVQGDMEELRGLDRHVKLVHTGRIHQTHTGDLSVRDMKYLFVDLSHLETTSGLQIDGLLGYPFFEQVKCSINYPNRRLYIW